MKLFAVAILCLGLLCSSTLAMAEGPVPFRALMQTPGAQPSVPPNTDAKDQSVSPQHGHMTTAGKIMAGTGIGMFVIGTVGLLGTAALSGWASPSDKAKLYGASGGAMAGGVMLVVLGDHRRSAQ